MSAPEPSGSPILNALYGAWRLANFDRSGMARFNVTADGFWHSFLAAVVGLPIYIAHVWLERGAAEAMLAAAGQTARFDSFYVSAGLAYVLMWPAFALLMIPLTRIAGVAQNYAALVIAWNWARIIAMIIRLPVMLMVAYGGLGSTALAVALLLTYGLILAYQWYVARVSLSSSGETSGSGAGLAAAAVVLADIVIGVGIGALISLVLGQPVQAVPA
jgi:hypothetical protein